ncbi:hypothetical protein HK102_002944, partial [Quaeritorhiza haematococci]
DLLEDTNRADKELRSVDVGVGGETGLHAKGHFEDDVRRLMGAIEVRNSYLCKSGVCAPGVVERKEGKRPHMEDPWFINHEIQRKSRSQARAAKLEHSSVVLQQESFSAFETTLINNIKAALEPYFSRELQNNHDSSRDLQSLQSTLNSLDANREWTLLKRRFPDRFATTEAPLPSEESAASAFRYQGMDHPFTTVVHQGTLYRKHGMITKSFKPGFYVLTAGGFLHGFPVEAERAVRMGELWEVGEPDVTIDLVECSLEPVGLKEDPEGVEFEIHERKEGLLKRTTVHTFKGANPAESRQWWDKLSEHTKTVVNVEHQIPAAAAATTCDAHHGAGTLGATAAGASAVGTGAGAGLPVESVETTVKPWL